MPTKIPEKTSLYGWFLLIYYYLLAIALMKIFVINLARSIERRSRLEKRLAELNIAAEFIKAVDGSALNKEELTKHVRSLNYAFLCGEIGCALSHQFIYRKMVEENIEKALILEDDVYLPHNLKDILKNITIETYAPQVVLLSKVNRYLAHPARRITDTHNLHRVHHATTTHSYIINKQAARNLLDNLYPVWMVADKWALFEDYSWVRVQAVVPAPIILNDNAINSTINESKDDNEHNHKKKIIWRQLMAQRPLKVKIKHRLRRALIPLFYKVINEKKKV